VGVTDAPRDEPRRATSSPPQGGPIPLNAPNPSPTPGPTQGLGNTHSSIKTSPFNFDFGPVSYPSLPIRPWTLPDLPAQAPAAPKLQVPPAAASQSVDVKIGAASLGDSARPPQPPPNGNYGQPLHPSQSGMRSVVPAVPVPEPHGLRHPVDADLRPGLVPSGLDQRRPNATQPTATHASTAGGRESGRVADPVSQPTAKSADRVQRSGLAQPTSRSAAWAARRPTARTDVPTHTVAQLPDISAPTQRPTGGASQTAPPQDPPDPLTSNIPARVRPRPVPGFTANVPYALSGTALEYVQTHYYPGSTVITGTESATGHPILALGRAVANAYCLDALARAGADHIWEFRGSVARAAHFAGTVRQCWCASTATDIARFAARGTAPNVSTCQHDFGKCDSTFDAILFVHTAYSCDPSMVGEMLNRSTLKLGYIVAHRFPEGIATLGLGEATYRRDDLNVNMSVRGNNTAYTHPAADWIHDGFFSDGTVAFTTVLERSYGDHLVYTIRPCSPTRTPPVPADRPTGPVRPHDWNGSAALKAGFTDKDGLISFPGTTIALPVPATTIPIGHQLLLTFGETTLPSVYVPRPLIDAAAAYCAGKVRDTALFSSTLAHVRNIRNVDCYGQDTGKVIFYAAVLGFTTNIDTEIRVLDAVMRPRVRAVRTLASSLAFQFRRHWRLELGLTVATVACFAIYRATTMPPGSWIDRLRARVWPRQTVATRVVRAITAAVRPRPVPWYERVLSVITGGPMFAEPLPSRTPGTNHQNPVGAALTWGTFGKWTKRSLLTVAAIFTPLPAARTVNHVLRSACVLDAPFQVKKQSSGSYRVHTPLPCNHRTIALLCGFGVRSRVPLVYGKCQANLIAAITNRVNNDPFGDDLMPDAAAVLLEHARSLPWWHGVPVLPCHRNTWLDHLPPARVRQLARTARDRPIVDSRTNIFVKIEATFKVGKAPRAIQARSDSFQYTAGPWTWTFNETLAHEMTTDQYLYACGKSAERIGAWRDNFAPLVEAGEAVFGEGDGSGWDRTMEHLLPVKNQCYADRGAPRIVLETYERDNTGISGHSTLQVSYRAPAQVTSGAPDTGTGNHINNQASTDWALKQAGVTPYGLITLGDDNLFCSPSFNVEVYLRSLRSLGIDPELTLHTGPAWSASFCSGLFWPTPEGSVWGPKIGRIVAKTTWLIDPGNTLNPTDWLRTVAKGFVRDTAHIPVLRVFFPTLLRACGPGRTVTPRKSYRPHALASHTACENTWALMAAHYGVTRAEVEDLEKWLERQQPPALLDHPVLDRIVAVDLPQEGTGITYCYRRYSAMPFRSVASRLNSRLAGRTLALSQTPRLPNRVRDPSKDEFDQPEIFAPFGALPRF
jgi:hypothetical protein